MSQPKQSFLFPLALVIYEISTYLSNDMYLPAVPNILAEFSLSTSQVQLTMTMWFLGLATMPLVVGVMADRYGRRPILLQGGIIYIFATILCAMTSNFSIFLFARFLEGSMTATMMVAGYACIHESFEHKEAVRILAIMGGVSVLAPALGPLFGSLILAVASWRVIFWVIAIWASLSIISLYYLMPETNPSQNQQRINWLALLKSYKQIITNRNYMSLMVILGLIFCGFIVWITSGSLLIIESFQRSPITFGFIQAMVFAAFIMGSHGVSYFVKQVDTIVLIRMGLLIAFISSLGLIVVSVIFPKQLALFLMALTIYSMGSALCFAPLNRAIIDTSDEPMGIRVAMFTVFFTMFGALGSILASLFYNGHLYSLSIPIFVVAGVAWFIYHKHEQRKVS